MAEAQQLFGNEDLPFRKEDLPGHAGEVICYERFGSRRYGIAVTGYSHYVKNRVVLTGCGVFNVEEKELVPVWNLGLSIYNELDDGVHSTSNLKAHNPQREQELCIDGCCRYKHENFRYRLAEPHEYKNKRFSWGDKPKSKTVRKSEVNMHNTTSQDSTVIGESPFAKSNAIAKELYRDLRSFYNFPRVTIHNGSQVQAVEAIRHCKVRYDIARNETHTLRITQLMKDQPAVITATREYADATGTTRYERVQPWTILTDTIYVSAARQIQALTEYFKSLPRPTDWGSVEDVAIINAQDADAVLVNLIHEHFGEVERVG